MTTGFTRRTRLFAACMLAMTFLGTLAAPASAAPRPPRTSMRCQDCGECAGWSDELRVVGLRIYNQSDVADADVNQILKTANRIWSPYGVCLQASTGQDAVTVVISRATTAAIDVGPAVLGDTLFTAGHATPYIHLWPGNAQALAAGAEIQGRPFASRSHVERDVILRQMLGVALAHEVAHYLLDTANHSAGGLLRGSLTVEDLAFPKPGHLRLTHEQQRLLCSGGTIAQ